MGASAEGMRAIFTSLKHNPYYSTQVAQKGITAHDTAQENEILIKYKAHCDMNGVGITQQGCIVK